MENRELISLFTKITASFNLLIVISSCILNPLIFYTCLKSKKLNSISTFKLIAISSLNDFICNIPWNFAAFTDSFFGLRLTRRSLFYCRFVGVFVQLASFQMASWLLVSISLDRYLSMKFKTWSKHWFVGKRPVIYGVVLWLVIIAINFNSVFNGGYSLTLNGIELILCFSNPPNEFRWYQTISQINLYFGYIVPYTLMVILNSLIILKATRFQRAQRIAAVSTSAAAAQNNRRKAEMTRTVYIITFFYIFTSLPSTIVAGYFFNSITVLPTGQMFINILAVLWSLYQTYNFFILYFSNKLFVKEIKSVISNLGIKFGSQQQQATKSNRQDIETLSRNCPSKFPPVASKP